MNIQNLVYDNSDNKFIRDPITDSVRINESYLSGLKEYAVLKHLVCASADKQALVDIDLLLSLID